ncbi:hypothetical protein AAFF_G00096720 [Aldrovandia affinis]|uniref:Uncharacterized protein n=1 Tax=Aldrovandia affinis TaxID=143900 RepID=A0AAD7RVA2_9TELE|nr:hypothetical protein AAFF_G00096720 [Aldrovandia affinis]
MYSAELESELPRPGLGSFYGVNKGPVCAAAEFVRSCLGSPLPGIPERAVLPRARSDVWKLRCRVRGPAPERTVRRMARAGGERAAAVLSSGSTTLLLCSQAALE